MGYENPTATIELLDHVNRRLPHSCRHTSLHAVCSLRISASVASAMATAAAEIRAARTRWIIIFVGSLRASSDSCGNCVRDPTPNERRRRRWWPHGQIKASPRHADDGWSTVTWRAVHLPSRVIMGHAGSWS